MLKKSVALAPPDDVDDCAVATGDAAETAEVHAAGMPVPSPARYGVLGGMCLIATIAYIQRNSLGVAEATIRDELNLSKEQMGAVMTAFFVSYALFQIPSGAIVRVCGVRRALTAFALTFSVMSGLFGVCIGWVSLVAVRLLMGFAQAGVFPASTTAISKWFPSTERAMPNGAISGFMQIGGAVGAMLTGWLMLRIGWRWMFAGYAIPGLVWAIWFYWWYRNSPAEFSSVRRVGPDDDAAEPAAVLSDEQEPTPWWTLLTNRSMAAVCGQQFCRACAATFFASWFATYLKETRGVSLAAAGVLTSLPMWSMMLGSFAGGYASDFVYRRTGSLNAARRGIALICMLNCAISASFTYFVADPVWATLLISAGSFWASMAGPCAYTFTIDVGGRHVAAVFSTMNMWGNIGSAVFPMMVPLFLNLTNDNWDLVLFLFVGLYLIAAGFWLLADASKPIFVATETESDTP